MPYPLFFLVLCLLLRFKYFSLFVLLLLLLLIFSLLPLLFFLALYDASRDLVFLFVLYNMDCPVFVVILRICGFYYCSFFFFSYCSSLLFFFVFPFECNQQPTTSNETQTLRITTKRFQNVGIWFNSGILIFVLKSSWKKWVWTNNNRKSRFHLVLKVREELGLNLPEITLLYFNLT